MQGQIKTQSRRQANHSDGDLLELPFPAESHHKRPNQVELFLDGERPGDSQQTCGGSGKRNQKILKKHWIGPPWRGTTVENGMSLGGTQQRYYYKHEEQRRIIKGPDP